ncbi:hypothetical protein [Cryobacterium tagatosivorans]|uniref:Uncharacterized protein n=1 Tax=Cryobacterium tagatosivorans TaxID=1259199 RepID=A0A4R8UEL5_9MICO|nr:hypothetical protein [Cryobacterium tagatosivorans]TFB48913.1 hypothetical protein E3O23_12670 [Cryobacterium tagatosivorans]
MIFENGTESSMYRQSLSIRLREAEGQALARAGRDLTEVGDADKESGHFSVLRSRSDDPQIAAMRDQYKIRFSRNSVEQAHGC